MVIRERSEWEGVSPKDLRTALVLWMRSDVPTRLFNLRPRTIECIWTRRGLFTPDTKILILEIPLAYFAQEFQSVFLNFGDGYGETPEDRSWTSKFVYGGVIINLDDFSTVRVDYPVDNPTYPYLGVIPGREMSLIASRDFEKFIVDGVDEFISGVRSCLDRGVSYGRVSSVVI